MLTAPPLVASAAPPVTTPAAPKANTKAPETNVTYSVLGHANESRPVAAAPKNSVPSAPAVTVPEYTAVSPLTYSAADPSPPDPSPDLVLLIRTARVDPDWEFSGRVEPPEFAKSMGNALGVSGGARPSQSPTKSAAPAKEKKQGGFWQGLRRLFGGGQPKREGA